MNGWNLLDILPGEGGTHRLFAHPAHPGRVAIADNSGATPELTDDGVLFIDVQRPLVGNALPLVDEVGNESVTVVSLAGVLYLADQHRMVIEAGGSSYRVVHIGD